MHVVHYMYVDYVSRVHVGMDYCTYNRNQAKYIHCTCISLPTFSLFNLNSLCLLSNSLFLFCPDFYFCHDVSISEHVTDYPIRRGVIEDWNLIERLWEQCIYKYLQTSPEDQYFLLTEPPLSTPEQREHIAELMFEGFKVPGLCISPQVSTFIYGRDTHAIM